MSFPLNSTVASIADDAILKSVFGSDNKGGNKHHLLPHHVVKSLSSLQSFAILSHNQRFVDCFLNDRLRTNSLIRLVDKAPEF